MQTLPEVQPTKVKKRTSAWGCLALFLAVLILFALVWIFVRPGVFTVQPIGALPDGVTLVYYGRSPEMPFFSSPDGLCLKIEGGVSLFCRMAALAGASDIVDRIIVRLPYMQWTYLVSTGGVEFEE